MQNNNPLDKANDQPPVSHVPLQKPVNTVPASVMNKMSKYAQEVRSKHPGWNQDKVAEKVLQKFKTKTV